MEWLPIDSAPKDGRPVWIRFHAWGDKAQPMHATWAWWNGDVFEEAGTQGSWLIYAIEWLPFPETPF